MGASQPTYLVQLQNDWTTKVTQLQEGYAAAKTKADNLATAVALPGNRSLEPAATQAALAEQVAAKAFNDFLNTGSTAYKVAQDIAATLNGPRTLSTLERHQLQTERRNLETAWEAFNDFKQTSGLKPIHVPPVYADNRIHFVDGGSQWDQSLAGKLFGAVDAVRAAGQDVFRAATLSQADQYTACVGVIDAFTGALMGKVLPAHGQWSARNGEVWDQLTGKAFDSSPAASTCRLIYPANNVPEFLRKYGAVQQGHDETLGALAAIDIDAKVLAQFGLADVLVTQVTSGGLDAAQAQQWLNDATASDELALFTPAPTFAMAPLQAGTLTAQQVIDVRQALGLPDVPDVSGPGTQYADSGTDGVVTDAGAGESGVGGIGYVPAVPTLSPIDTTDASSVHAVNGADSQSDAARSGISLATTMANGGLLFRESTIAGASLTPFHMEVLNSSPSGVAVIELAASKNVPIEIREGSATFYSAEPQFGAPNGIIVIGADRFNGITHHANSDKNTVANAVTVVSLSLHEAAHALDHLDGTPLPHPKDFATPSDYATARAQSEGNSLSAEGRFDAEIQGQRYTPPGSTTAVTITPDIYIVGTGRVGGTYLGDAVDGAFDRRLNEIYNDPTLSLDAKATLAASEGTQHNLNQVASTSNTTYLDQGLVDYAAYWSGVPAGQITGVQIDDNGQTWAVSTRAGATEITVNYGNIDTTRPAGTGSAQAVSRVETTIDDDGNRMVTVVDYGRGSQSTTTYSPTGTVVGQALTPIGTTDQAPPVQTAGPAEAPAPAPPVSPMEPNIPAVPAPAPTFRTIRVNANTTFLLNEDGDIVSETVTGLGGYTSTRSNTGERNYTDADGNAITGDQYDQYQTDRAEADKGAAGISDYVGFVNAMAGLRNWDDMSDIQRLSALTGVISQANALSDGALAGSVGVSSSALQGTGAALGFLAAAERGDTAGMILNAGSFADAVGDKVFSNAVGDALGMNAAGVLPGLNMIAALARGDAMGAGTAAMSTILAMNALPGVGQVFAAFVLVGSFLMGKDEPPQQHGNAQAQWGDQGELDYGLQYNEGGGGKTAEKYASALVQSLQEAVGKQPELAIIPERVPRVGWVLEPGQDNLDRVYLEWEDASGQRHTRWYTDEGQPQPNRHGESAGVKDIASDFLEIALSQGAVAPAAEVAELRQNWIEAMAPVVALEAQIAELDKLAEPVRPFQRMEGQQGLIWYDSVNPLRLAELEGQMAPLQQQADELRAKAKAQFDAELSGIEGVGTGDRPQTEVELQFIKEVLADGSGTLHITRDGKGGEVRWLEANNTREFDGKEGHTHGGVRDPNVATEKTIEAGDEDLQSTTNKTIASTTVQTKTTVGVGDARVVDGEDGQVVSGQDGTQQTAAGPGGSAVISQTLAAVAQESAADPAEPAEDRTTVTVGEGIGAPSDAVTQPVHTVQETNTVAQGQDATQQAEGHAVQHDGAAGTALEGQADASHEAVDAESGDVVSNEGVANAPAPSDTITVKSGDSRITSTTAAPAPRPASPAPVAFVPQQPATQEQERRQAVAAMVNSAQAANPMGGDAALAGLAAVGIAASGAHMGAQAQPIVAQQVAQAAQAELETQAAQAESSTGQAPVPAISAVNPGTHLTANPDGPAQPLQLTQVNLGSYQVANVSTQPVATAPAAPAEPVQPGIRAEVTVQWQGSAAAPIAPAPAPTPVATVAAPIAPPAVLQSAVFADQPLGGAPAPAPAPAVVPAPVPDITSGAGGDTPVMPPPPVPATPLPIAPLAQQPFVWSDAPLLSLTVWGGAEDTGLLFTPDMLAPSRPGEGEMTLTAVGNVIGGEVALVDGQIVFRPDPHFNGEASFSYTVRNAWGFSSTGTAQLLVEAVNDAPVAQADSLATDEDRVLWLDAGSLLANDSDVDDGLATLRIASVGAASGGTVTLHDEADGTQRVSFAPDAHFHGAARFEYTVIDPQGATSTSTAQVQVVALNDAPVAQGDAAGTDEDTAIVFTQAQLLANDSDADTATDAQMLGITAVAGASHGTVTLLANGDVRFVPDAHHHGPAGFTYTVSDGAGGTAEASVSLTVLAVNDTPVAMGESAAATEDTTLVIAAATLLANDSDADMLTDGQILSISAMDGATHGGVSLVTLGDGSQQVHYTPHAHYHGPAQFRYTVSDGAGGTATAIATLNVQAVNDLPVAQGETASLDEDNAITFTQAQLLANDGDADGATDGQVLSITAVAGATHGAVTLLANGDVRFVPDANYHGPAQFSYTVSDGAGGTADAVVNLSVLPVNDTPVAVGDLLALPEDTAATITAADLLGNDTDADAATDGDVLTLTRVFDAQHCTAVLNADGTVSFTPEPNYHGNARFSYQVTDALGATSTAVAVVGVNAVNDAPEALADSMTLQEDQRVVLDAAALLANDSDEDVATDGDSIRVASVGHATGGTVRLLAGGQIEFIPDAHFHGVAGFDYMAADTFGATSTARMTLNVTPVNDLPVAQDESASLDEDNAITFTQAQLLANDSDADGTTDGQVLSITAVAGAQHGTVTLLANGDVRFVPDADYHGPAQFGYTVSDGAGGTADASVSLTVLSVNDTPVAVGESASAAEDATLVIAASTLLANDSDADTATDGQILSISAVDGATHGSVSLVTLGDGSQQVHYTPDANYHGPAQFRYTVSDGAGGTTRAMATLTVTPVNDLPVVQGETATTQEDTALSWTPFALLANATDADTASDGQVLSIQGVQNAQHGVVSLAADGKVTFTPDANHHGAASFQYVVTDGAGGTAAGTVTLNVTAVNDLPVAQGEAASLHEDNAVIFTQAQLLANDSDADLATDGQVLSLMAVAGVQHGTVSLLANGDVRFVPDADYHGPAGFTYTVSDGAGGTADASVSLTVLAVNDAPVALGETANSLEDRVVQIDPASLLANDTDVDDAQAGLRITAVGAAQGGTVALQDLPGGAQRIEFVPTPNWHGTASFNYTVADPQGASSVATAVITIAPENDAPAATGETTSVAEDTGLLFTAASLLANDTDVDGDTLQIVQLGAAQGGAAWLQADGSVRFQPDANYHGPAGFSYTVQDAAGSQATATVSLTVLPVNDLPQLTGEVVNGDEDVVLLIAPALLLVNDADVEASVMTLTSVGAALHGSVALVNGPDGQPQIEFVPEPNYHGVASFEYEVTDADGGTSRATVVLNLAEVNDAPVAQADDFAGTEDTSLVIALTQLTGNDADGDGDALTVTAVGAPTGGTVQLEAGTVRFTPQPDYFGPASFVYTVQDGRGGQAQALATLQIAPVNDAPVVGGEAIAGVEDVALVIAPQALLANDQDFDSTHLAITAVGNAHGGTVVVLADGNIRFDPLADHTGAAGFDYTVSDGDGGHTVASVVVQLAALNDAPRLLGEAVAATEDTPLSIAAAALLANDTDVDGTHTDLYITAVGNAAHGSVSLTADGRIVFTPDADYAGTAGFDYTVADAQGAASTVRATLQVAPVNDAPRLVGESVNADEDTVIRLTAARLLGNDVDVDGDTLAIASAGDATHGAVALQADGSIVFTPTLNYNGAAAFTYTVSDGAGGLSQASVNLNLAAVNDAPSLQVDHLSTPENQPVTVNAASLLANDADVDGPHAALQVTTAGNARHGSVSLANGQVTFTPDADYFGPAAFDYTVTDADGGQATATAHVNVQWVNRAPVAAADTLATQNEDTNVLILAGALLANDSDGDSARGATDSLRIHSVAAIAGQTHGTVSLTAEGNVLFVPDADYVGPVNFNYVVSDAAGLQSGATAGFSMANVNDAPTVVGEVISAKNQTEVWIDPATLLANDTDRDSIHAPQDLRLVAVDGATHGSVALQGDGRILFTPTAPGAGSFSYTVQDAAGATAQATALVNTGNAAPVAVGESTTLAEDQVRTFSPAELLANDTDADNAHADLHITAVGGATGGSAVLNAQGQVVFTPTLNHSGAAGFSYTVADGDGGTSQASVNLSYTSVNDAPTAVGETLTFNEDQIAYINTATLLANDSDVDGPGALSVSSISDVSGGSASLQGSQVVFTPWVNFNGYGGFNYTVSDGAGGVSQARADVYFNPVNDAPVVNNELYAGNQDTTLYFSTNSLLANDTDVETPGSLSIVNASGLQGGSAYLSGSTVVFTPTAGYVGQASFQYTVADPQGGTGYGTTTINLARVNRSPVALDDSFSTQEDLATNISYAQLLSNDSDDGGAGALRVTWVGNAWGGNVTDHGTTAVFNPAYNHSGSAGFHYEVTDADGARTNATAYINVAPVNDIPYASNDYFTAQAGTPIVIYANQLLGNDGDAEGALSLAGIDGAVNGNLQWVTYQQSFMFTAYQAGPAQFMYAASDSSGVHAHAYGIINVLPAPDYGGYYPVALDMDGDGVELVSAAESLIFADVDADGADERLGWVSPDDAVLAYDADDNGQIDIATETSFLQYVAGAKTDLEGLAAFDTDGDGALTAADAEWARFGALQDANASGRQEAGEFQSLDALDIQSISLTRQGTPTVVEGNTVFGTAAVTHTDGSVTQAADVMFAVQEVEQEEVEMDETAHFNNLAQSFNQLCAAVAAEPVAGEALIAVAPLAELSLATTPDAATVMAPLVEAANAGTMTVAATG
jgi:hypothetical protein